MQNSTPISQGSSGRCAELCLAVGSCASSWATPEACKEECGAMTKVVRPVVLDLYTSCGAKASCASFDKKVCLREGANPVPRQVALGLADTLCDKLDTCLGGTMQPGECDNLKKDPGMLALLDSLKIYIDPVFLCTAQCLATKDCAALFQSGITLAAQCAETCGARSAWSVGD